jgi:hypothetical protein
VMCALKRVASAGSLSVRGSLQYFTKFIGDGDPESFSSLNVIIGLRHSFLLSFLALES